MRKEMNDLTKSFPEDDFDLERLKWQTIAQKKGKKFRKVFKPKNVEPKENAKEKSLNSNSEIVKDGKKNTSVMQEVTGLVTKMPQVADASMDSVLDETDGSDSFPEASFDLDDFKKNVLTQKRERFWKRKTKLFYLLSTLSMIAMFVLAYYIFHFLSDLILAHTGLR